MFNYGLILKILEIKNETEHNVQATMINLSNMINEKFKVKLILHIADSTPDEAQMEKLLDILEEGDEITEESLKKFQAWAEGTTFDFDVFMDDFEDDLHAVELQVIEGIADKLSDAEKKEVIDYLQTQIEEEREEEEEIMDETINAAIAYLEKND